MAYHVLRVWLFGYIVFVSLFLCGDLQAVVYNEAGGLVIMEMENTESPLSNWDVKTALAGYTGSGYLKFDGNHYTTGPADSPLEYHFKINEAGLYYLHMRCAKERHDGRTDVSNDCYVRVEGDYEAGPGPYTSHGDNAALSVLKNDIKYFGGGIDRWVWADGDAHIDLGGHDNLRVALYDFKAGETYKLVVSGRARYFRIDRLMFRKSTVAKSYAQDLSRPESSTINGGNGEETYVYDARTDFPNITAGEVPYYEHMAENALAIDASNESYRDKFARAELTFAGTADTYDVTITTLRELDGECTYRFLVNGSVVGTAQNSTTTTDYTPENHTFRQISIPAGAVLAVESNTDSNGLVSEAGDGNPPWAWARGRWTTLTLGPPEESVVNPPAGRVAYVADGNSPDPDDIGANAVMLGLLSGAKMQDRLVHFSHSCDLNSHISPASEDVSRQNYMTQKAVEGIAHFGPFTNLSAVYNCNADQAGAVNDLRNAINASSASDPLWIIEAGEPDIIGYALQAANASARQYVHVVSHHPGNDDSGDYFTWAQILAFGVTEHQIGDQNVGLQVQISSGGWDWAEGHSDPAMVWILDQLKYAEADGVVGFQTGKYDCSDAGMMYWWLTGGDNGGNAHSTPVEIKAMLLDQYGAPPTLAVVAGWGTWDNAAAPSPSVVLSNVSASAVTTYENLAWHTSDSRGASSDGTWGNLGVAVVASTNVVAVGECMELPNATSGGDMTFTISNDGGENIVLNAFHFDALAFRRKAPRTYTLSVLAGGGITPGTIYSSAPDEIPSSNGLPPDNDSHDDIDLDLTGLADHTLAPGESVQFQLVFSGGANDDTGGHDLWIDNVAVSKSITVAPVAPPMLSHSLNETGIAFNWTEAGFKVQSRTNLTEGVWEDVPAGEMPPVEIVPAASSAFYRLTQQ